MTYKCVLVLLACTFAMALARPSEFDNGYIGAEFPTASSLARQVRSPQHGSVNIDYTQDRNGKSGAVQYNHNLHTSSDGRFKVDAYGRASRDFTHNRNDYGGGVVGTWRF